MARNRSVILFLIGSILIFSFPFLAFSESATDSGCVKCHTNEKILRTLHAPLKVELSEGVG